MSTTYSNPQAAAKAYAAKVGVAGRKGGWLYDARGVTVCQGWDAYVSILTDQHVIVDPNGQPMATREGVLRNPADRWSAPLRNVFGFQRGTTDRTVVLTDRLRRVDAMRAASWFRCNRPAYVATSLVSVAA